MRKHSFIFLLSFFSLFISGQVNLVPNPSFENVSMCPSALTQISLAAPWFQAGTGTPDLFVACSTNTDVGVPVNLLGNQAPNTGDKYSGIELTVETIENILRFPLQIH
ncbi:MAG: hypothetical protein IPJ60_04985 [Sphingobacteriaceae bacterium]|nr:hypothetical protein [Sphingobacteriaceae bacterium]